MQFNLVPHPGALPADPGLKLWANVDYAGSLGQTATVNIWFGVGAPAERFVIPEGEPGREDELWQTTCLEAFLREAGRKRYREWNFAPSGQWAAYDFSTPRKGMKNADLERPPYIRTEDNLTWWAVGATFAVEADKQWELGLSAVLEEKDGTKSYWALAHGGDKPDFHDPGCFIGRLP
jgi:hypothetical protein